MRLNVATIRGQRESQLAKSRVSRLGPARAAVAELRACARGQERAPYATMLADRHAAARGAAGARGTPSPSPKKAAPLSDMLPAPQFGAGAGPSPVAEAQGAPTE